MHFHESRFVIGHIALIYIIFFSADRMPRISVTPRRRTDPLQYRATFKCLVDGTGPFHVTWSRKDARPLPVGRSRVLTRDSTWILIISSLRVADEGQYVCTARNQFGIASYGVRITVYGEREKCYSDNTPFNRLPISLHIFFYKKLEF